MVLSRCVCGYRHLVGLWCLKIHRISNAWLFVPWSWSHHDPSKCWETFTHWHNVIFQKAWIIRIAFHYVQTLYHFTVGTGSPLTMHFNSRLLPLSIINSEEFILVSMLIGSGAAIWIMHYITLFCATKYNHRQMPYGSFGTKCKALESHPYVSLYFVSSN